HSTPTLFPYTTLFRSKADDVAAKYRVSRAWVHRLVQRRRETGGEIGPRPQTRFRVQALAGQEARLRSLVDAQPDRTLAELRTALDRKSTRLNSSHGSI